MQGECCEVQDENEKVELGDKMDSKLEVRGGILVALGAWQSVAFSPGVGVRSAAQQA